MRGVMILALALAFASSACATQARMLVRTDVAPSERYLVVPPGLPMFGPESAPLNAAVIEFLLNRPELPFLGGVLDPAQIEAHRVIARDLAPRMNQLLADDGQATIMSLELLCHVLVLSSRQAKVVIVQASVWGKQPSLTRAAYDLSQVPGAFDPSAPLDVITVEARARVLAAGG